jgi:protein-L-isoaspartate(D-aspartate) O-methyltransferase
MTTSHGQCAALVDQLAARGHLHDPAWRAAWLATPREEFVPYFFEPHRNQPGWRLLTSGDDSRGEWLAGVYSMGALVTQLDGDDGRVDAARHGETVSGTPTSSSSAPTLMAAMLDALDVAEGHRVLEAATGTGYNAALLAHRLGGDQVTSIEVDPGLTTRAISALRRLGRTPHVITGDAAAGSPSRAPFDRVIATVALPHVPAAWLAQSHPAAVLVVPLVLAGHGGIMVRLERDQHGGAHGHVSDHYGGFMATRTAALPDPPRIRRSLLDRLQPTRVPVDALGGSHPASFFLALLVPPFRTLGFTPDGSQVRQTWGRGLDGSTFAAVEQDGGQRVATEGPIWEEIENAYQRWLDLGRPERHRAGITVSATGEHTLWLDKPSLHLRAWARTT